MSRQESAAVRQRLHEQGLDHQVSSVRPTRSDGAGVPPPSGNVLSKPPARTVRHAGVGEGNEKRWEKSAGVVGEGNWYWRWKCSGVGVGDDEGVKELGRIRRWKWRVGGWCVLLSACARPEDSVA